MNGSSWTRRVVTALAVALTGFVLACGQGAPDNPTPTPSTTTYPHPTP